MKENQCITGAMRDTLESHAVVGPREVHLKNYEERNYFPEIVFPSFPYPVNSNHVNTDTKGAEKGGITGY